MTVDQIKAEIEAAFANTPSPGAGFNDISPTQWDEGIVDYFRRTTWRGHNASNLRIHSAALSFFTDKAFRYWLPAFMFAELDHPEQADVIAESIAFKFTKSTNSPQRLASFNHGELRAIVLFLEECARRYGRPYTRNFNEAEAAVQNQIEKTTIP